MAQLVVKNTFLDFSSDYEEERVIPTRTCPSRIITPPDSWATPIGNKSCIMTPPDFCTTSTDDSEEEEAEVDGEVDRFFSVKTLNAFSPHRQEQGVDFQCECGNTFMPDTNFCRKCGKERCQAVCALVEHVRYVRQAQCACGHILTPGDNFCGKCGREQKQQCVCGNVLMPDANFCRKCGKKRCQALCLPLTSLVASDGYARTTQQPPSVRRPVEVILSNLVAVDAGSDDVTPENRRPELSHGALLHDSGMCKPCGFFWKSHGCEFGKECLHCHLCPKGELKSRRRKHQKKQRSAKAAERRERREQQEQE
jgi:uncharacterized OB-fold protein